MAPSPGVSGLALLGLAAGGLIGLAGLKNATISDTVRALIKGQPVPSQPSQFASAEADVTKGLSQIQGPLSAGASGLGATVYGQALASRIVAEAQAQLGKPYVWGADGPDKFDCSGLVSYVLRQVGVFKPGQRFVTGEFYVWSGATTVPRPPQAGDLICWTSHIAIAISATRMIAAPHAGVNVREQDIYWTGSPLVRRIKGVT